MLDKPTELTVLDHRFPGVMKLMAQAFIAALFFFAPIVFGRLLDSWFLQALGFLFGMLFVFLYLYGKAKEERKPGSVVLKVRTASEAHEHINKLFPGEIPWIPDADFAEVEERAASTAAGDTYSPHEKRDGTPWKIL